MLSNSPRPFLAERTVSWAGIRALCPSLDVTKARTNMQWALVAHVRDENLSENRNYQIHIFLSQHARLCSHIVMSMCMEKQLYWVKRTDIVGVCFEL